VKHIKDLQSTHAETIIPTGKLQIAENPIFLSETTGIQNYMARAQTI
jgi:hypothetical protein